MKYQKLGIKPLLDKECCSYHTLFRPISLTFPITLSKWWFLCMHGKLLPSCIFLSATVPEWKSQIHQFPEINCPVIFPDFLKIFQNLSDRFSCCWTSPSFLILPVIFPNFLKIFRNLSDLIPVSDFSKFSGTSSQVVNEIKNAHSVTDMTLRTSQTTDNTASHKPTAERYSSTLFKILHSLFKTYDKKYLHTAKK